MQLEPSEHSTQLSQSGTLSIPSPTSQHGLQHHQQPLHGAGSASGSRSATPTVVAVDPDASPDATNSDGPQLAGLGGLNIDNEPGASQQAPAFAGQRIAEYERAMTPSTPKHPSGFTVTKRVGSPSEGVQLTDFPNEILTHVISHLHPDLQSVVALVSKRFYALVTEPHAWRMAFTRFFPGRESVFPTKKADVTLRDADEHNAVRSETREFTRLTALASWRSEYLLRNRLLRGAARGKPGATSGIGSASRSSSSKKAAAVLTYNSKLPWMITNVHAVFSNGKKPPRVTHGAADLCVVTSSDPTSGKVEKTGLDDPFSFAQLDEMFPSLDPYGVGEGPAAVRNVMDVSQSYGTVGGEGFPGGRAFFRPAGKPRGFYLGAQDNAIVDQSPEIPKIPELSDAISCVWIAKSSVVPSITQSMVGIMTGSTLGVITTYALGSDSTGPRFTNGDITARWVVSPGVPIIALKVDDNYSLRRRAVGRVFAVALNALGEVYYLTDTPKPLMATKVKGQDPTRTAWYAGRSVYWDLVEPTRRTARPDDLDKNAIRGAYSPRSPSDAMDLSTEQLVAEAKEIEKFLRYKPSHFRRVCIGWDMRRRLEVDFGGCDEFSAGEGIFVIDCGLEEAVPPKVTRYTRRLANPQTDAPEGASSDLGQQVSSLFGGGRDRHEEVGTERMRSGLATPVWPRAESQGNPPSALMDWGISTCSFKCPRLTEITASAMDNSLYAVLTSFEDPLQTGPAQTSGTATPILPKAPSAEIPGRRARLIAIGTDTGAVFVWNARDNSTGEVEPLRVIQTESPEVSCLALSALYLVHGGSDGLVQAWDPLASTTDAIRTLNSRSSGRIPRHVINANPTLRQADYSSVGAIVLDPDPTVLRGVVAFGIFLRYWSYSAATQPAGRKRRLRHADIHGRLVSRRHGGGVLGYIAAEEAELRHEQERRKREDDRLRNRFGVGLGDLTEEEAIRYAQMISEESLLLDEQRRLSASDTGSAADTGETASSTGSAGSTDTVTPEPSLSGLSGSGAGPSRAAFTPPVQEETDDDYELQIQQALRLSLLEGVNDAGQSPRGSNNNNSSGEYEFSVRYKPSKKDKGKRSPPPVGSSPPGSRRSHASAVVQDAAPPSAPPVGPTGSLDPDDELELALRLSLQEEEERQSRVKALGLGLQEDEFPDLEVRGKGKGRQL
ncbi:uncharacterized protein E0L32_005581 [Thyridium curvatum]|uniref:F-box domain-containing protein n=1 Tax=Thyridium curvatum TaxID=1093900 RepID=A0A507AU94_9PEZI|nr:uncharacterized protein E0L32_005581 [Thyridium curvatum]TPX14385.1 hypothetical protein E0L32_005581 [Thyridium curvatum]